MPGTGTAEIYFIAAMMVLTIILSGAAVYFFVRTYRREMRDKAIRDAAKRDGPRST
ncbi:MAG: hypothetical protein ABR530_03260 [Pyrinomonadaceae bacterium]